jgi:hypothetical protein
MLAEQARFLMLASQQPNRAMEAYYLGKADLALHPERQGKLCCLRGTKVIYGPVAEVVGIGLA